jgi:hypothetical protein
MISGLGAQIHLHDAAADEFGTGFSMSLIRQPDANRQSGGRMDYLDEED